MKWREIVSLLSGLGPDTPLVRTVQIRLENDPKVLKHYTSAQHRIRNKWRSRRHTKKMSQSDMNNVIQQFQAAFASAFA